MSRPLSMSAPAAVDASSKGMRVSIQFHGGSTIACGSDSIVPLFYSTLESPAVIRATATLEVDEECSGDEVEINYKASATYKAPVQTEFTMNIKGEDIYQRKRWTMDMNRPSTGKIAAGRYSKDVSATIDPLWPSSVKMAPHAKGFGWVKYVFTVNFNKLRLGALAPVLTASQEVWVLNSTLPTSLLQGVPPLIAQTSWKKSTIPVSLTLPSETLTMGQLVPVKVHMNPFTDKSKYRGQTIDVLKASFILREHILGNAPNGQQFKYTRDVISVPITEGWPHSTGPWEKTVNLTMPTSPQVSPTTTTKCFKISYSILLVMKLKAGSQKEKKADDYELQVVPRHEPERIGDGLPAYTVA
ncbi:MAG: hypothetical protein J3Q66DRAFT_406036 [Benniella sp.]|nr:MAG: hypothetical protein J3Q66DRAFT_406036 [Benniella sp.]